jgi:hypothetical protein
VWWHGRPRQSGQWPDRLVSLAGLQKAEGQTHDPAKAVRLRRAVGGTGRLNDQRVKDALDPGMQMRFPATPGADSRSLR